MALTTKKLERVFMWENQQLPDIPGINEKEVLKVYSGQYAELINATIIYKGIIDDKETYEISKSTGVKG